MPVRVIVVDGISRLRISVDIDCLLDSTYPDVYIVVILVAVILESLSYVH